MRKILLSSLVAFCASFIIDIHVPYSDQCLAPPPCVCYVSTVNCEGANFSDVPPFRESHEKHGWLSIILKDNHISVIDNASFVNLDTTNATRLEMDLSKNQISSISDSAFSSITSILTVLNLRNNNLTQIPPEVGSLVNLEILDIRGNPIRNLSIPVIFALSRSLRTLSIGLDLFSKWPPEMHYFRLLSKLTIDGFQLLRLPLGALRGMETTLESLDITNTRLDRIPSFVCHLLKLRHLTYKFNPDTKSPILEPCSQNITSLRFLDLSTNNLTRFPIFFKTFVSLVFLDVRNNEIQTISTDLIPQNNVLTHLDLSSNLFNRVPTAVNQFTGLQVLNIAENRITSLEKFDFMNLTNLRELRMQNNPIEYISRNAFQNNIMLRRLNIANTNIDVIPYAVTLLPRPVRVDVDHVPIQCTCRMDYLKSWTNNASRIYGTCEGTNETLSSFITSFLPLCP